jgi:hypothetical protein
MTAMIIIVIRGIKKKKKKKKQKQNSTDFEERSDIKKCSGTLPGDKPRFLRRQASS